jgi:uncharacterized cupin superfamily protein
MPVIDDPMRMPERRGTAYPAQHATGFEGRVKRPLTEALGLTQFGANVTTIEPGAMSSHRHWHSQEDEFIFMLSGELILVTNEGERVLKAGQAAGFPRGEANGHQLVNRGTQPATYLEIGTRSADEDVTYPDVDMKGIKRDGRMRWVRKNGEPFT